MRIVLLSVIAAATSAQAPAQGRLALLSGSRVWIEGTSNVNAFTCEGNRITGQGAFGGGGQEVSDLSVVVPVRSLDCGNRQMNKDLFTALKGAAHPRITFSLSGLTTSGGSSASWQRARAAGQLQVAGISRPAQLDLQVRRLPDGRLQLRGSAALLMSDFGIEPPTAMLGLIKARNAFTVHVDLVAAGLSDTLASTD